MVSRDSLTQVLGSGGSARAQRPFKATALAEPVRVLAMLEGRKMSGASLEQFVSCSWVCARTWGSVHMSTLQPLLWEGGPVQLRRDRSGNCFRCSWP